MPSTETDLIATQIETRIHEVRGHNVMLDHDLKYDDQFKVVFEAIRQLMEPPPEPAKVSGFRTDGEE